MPDRTFEYDEVPPARTPICQVPAFGFVMEQLSLPELLLLLAQSLKVVVGWFSRRTYRSSRREVPEPPAVQTERFEAFSGTSIV